jgi:GntR family transcriptional regulator
MLFDIDSRSDVPIWEQIVTQVTFAIASGALEAGTLIPSVRKLSGQITVNPNTVARAYQELERRGIVVPRRGEGMEVTPEAPDSCRRQRYDIIRDRIRGALREAVSSALAPDEIRSLVEEELVRVNGTGNHHSSGSRKRGPAS